MIGHTFNYEQWLPKLRFTKEDINMARLNFIWSLSRFNKRLISILIDTLFIFAAFYGAYWTRIGSLSPIGSDTVQAVLMLTVVVTVLTFTKLGLYRAVLRYLTFHALAVVAIGTIVSAVMVAVSAFYFTAPIPRSVPIIYAAFLCILCGGSRLF